ncbi:hypothetical protein CsSME_00041151 [Camellia sinensis var. sinensis]
MSQQSFRVCFCCRRMFRVRAAEPPEDVKELFKRYSENESRKERKMRRRRRRRPSYTASSNSTFSSGRASISKLSFGFSSVTLIFLSLHLWGCIMT